jgi:hypothetical protein
MNKDDVFTARHEHLVDMPQHAHPFSPGTVYFIDLGDEQLNEQVAYCKSILESNEIPQLTLFNYHIETLMDRSAALVHLTYGVNLFTAIVPYGGHRQLLVHKITEGTDVLDDILNFIHRADELSSRNLKPKMLSLAMRDEDLLNDLLRYEIPPMNYDLSENCCIEVMGSSPDKQFNIAEEKSHVNNEFKDVTKKFILGDKRAKDLLYQRLKDIDSNVLARGIMKMMKDNGFEASLSVIPYFVDYYMGVVETRTKVLVKTFPYQKGTDGALRVVFQSDYSETELPIHFTHKESAALYILLLKAHIDQKSGTLRELVERNASAFKTIYKKVYKIGDDEALDAYKKIITRKTSNDTISKAESKLKLCKSDINAKVQVLLKDYDNPFPFMIDGKKGRLYVPDERFCFPTTSCTAK